MSVSVCLHAYLCYQAFKLHHNIVHVICSLGSVLFWRRCDMLCTSGFMDDVMFHIVEN